MNLLTGNLPAITKHFFHHYSMSFEYLIHNLVDNAFEEVSFGKWVGLLSCSCVTLVHFIKCKSTFSYYKVDIYKCFNKAINAHEIGLSSSKKNVGQSTRVRVNGIKRSA